MLRRPAGMGEVPRAWLLVLVLGVCAGIAVPVGGAVLTGKPLLPSSADGGGVPTSPTPSSTSAALETVSPDASAGPKASPKPSARPTSKLSPKPTPRPAKKPDPRRPVIVSRSPASGVTGVGRGTTITITFSEQVRGVSGATIQLYNVAGGWSVNTVVDYISGSRRAVLDPVRNMYPATQYRVVVGSGISDVAGNRLAPVTWQFRTAAG